jgi:cytochrome c-type biogenesis protein
MSLPEISNPYLGAFTIGLFYGLVVCTASCLPYVTSYIAGIGADFRKGVKVTFIFNSGRILAYALIGGLIGLFSGLVALVIPETTVSPFQVYSSLVFGVVTAVIGASILLKARKPSSCNLQDAQNTVATGRVGRFGVDFGAFSLGLTRGLIICPPLITLLMVYALPFSNPVGSVTLAVLFGLGTTVSPILVLGGVTGWLLNKAPLFRKWISIAGGAILIALGTITIVDSIIQLR